MALLDGILAYWNLNDNGSGGVSLVDSTGNGYTLTNNGGVTLGTGIIGGDAVFNGSSYLYDPAGALPVSQTFSVVGWVYGASLTSGDQRMYDDSGGIGLQTSAGLFGGNFCVAVNGNIGPNFYDTGLTFTNNSWNFFAVTLDSSFNLTYYVNQNSASINIGSSHGPWSSKPTTLGVDGDHATGFLTGSLDEIGVWSRALTPTEVNELWNSGFGNTYPFQSVTTPQYYNNNQEDGDWGNILNWWIDSGFTIQSGFLPTSSTPVNLYNQVTQNTQGANQCFCASANFWSADFAYGLTLQSTGVVNMQGSSVMAGHTTDGVSMHDSSTLADTSVIDADVTMRDSSRAFGYIGGNAYVYYDTGNGQFPIGGTVAGSVSYLGWPAVTPQWFNDQVSGGADDGDFSNKANWWTDNNYTTRPVNAEGTQELPDASTDVFIAPNVGITANTGTSNPTINSVTAYNSNIQNISITATNGFLFSGNEGVENAVLYGNVTFQDTAYNYQAIINGTATYKSAASLQNSWGENSLANLNFQLMEYGSTGFVVSIPTGNSRKGFLSSLLGFPWYIRF